MIESKLAPVGTKGGLSAVIADGSRAITVRVNDVVGVAGFALPGNYVDVIVNTQEQQGKTDGQSISKIVLEHILVLAVAQQVSRDDTAPKVVNAVTLEVTPTRPNGSTSRAASARCRSCCATGRPEDAEHRRGDQADAARQGPHPKRRRHRPV